MKTKEELELLKLSAEIKTLVASRAKLRAERLNLLSPREAQLLQRLQPFLGALAIMASLTFAVVTWVTKQQELQAKDVDLNKAQQEVMQARIYRATAILSADKAEKAEQEAEAKQREAEQHAKEANNLLSQSMKALEDVQATLPELSAPLKALQAEIQQFGKEPYTWAGEIRDSAPSQANVTELATKIQQWFVTRNDALEPPPSDPLEQLRKTLAPAAEALFKLPPKKWSTPEFFALLRLCRQDRRYVGLLAEYALNHKEKVDGWLYTALVFRNITYEDTQDDKKRMEEYADKLVPFLNEARQLSPDIKSHAEVIFSFLPRQYRAKR